MSDSLAEFLREEARRRFDWREAHCLLMPADWAVRNGAPDPASGFRDLGGEAEARSVLDTHGGVLGLAAQLLRDWPRAPTDGVRRGDIGVVAVERPEGWADVGAICTGARWVGRGPAGLWAVSGERVRVGAAWRLPAAIGRD